MRIAELITNWRRMNDMSVRETAREIGISASALTRIEAGKLPDAVTLIVMFGWLFGAEEKGFTDEKAPTTNAGDQRNDVPMSKKEG